MTVSFAAAWSSTSGTAYSYTPLPSYGFQPTAQHAVTFLSIKQISTAYSYTLLPPPACLPVGLVFDQRHSKQLHSSVIVWFSVSGKAINAPANLPGINSMMNQQNTQNNNAPNKPRSFINVIFFDEQFKSYDYKLSMIGDAGTVKDHYIELQNIFLPP